jgi:hypothetical protein
MSDISSDDLNQNRGGRLEDMADDQEDEPTKRYTVDLPKSLHEWLEEYAFYNADSMKEVLIEALEEYRRRHD